MDGFLLLNKPRGITSHQAVAAVRRMCGERSCGHGGTLDPLAEGLLILALGKVTRLLEYLTALDKRYTTTAVLGAVSATDDAEGPISVITKEPNFTTEQIEHALDSFRGEIDQRPPSYSAVSVDGRRLYASARQGVLIDAPLRRVTVHNFDLDQWQPPRLELSITCSKGTYVRSLVRDLGLALGCGAYVDALRRDSVGPYALSQAWTLEQIDQRRHEIGSLLLHPAAALAGWPIVRVDEAGVRELVHGREIASEEPTTSQTFEILDERGQTLPSSATGSKALGSATDSRDRAAALDSDGRLIAVLEKFVNSQSWRPKKVLV